jgi:hypothetical protein
MSKETASNPFQYPEGIEFLGTTQVTRTEVVSVELEPAVAAGVIALSKKLKMSPNEALTFLIKTKLSDVERGR